MKTTNMYTLAALFAVTVISGLGYNAWMDYRDQKAYAAGMALLAAQETKPTTRRTIVEDDVTWYEKCEQGFCFQAANPESLEHLQVRKGGGSGGVPVTDMAAFREMEKRAQQANSGPKGLYQ
ncbi:MAG: hypothetical protein WC749_00120 [Dehalococcoidia bacterium]